MLFLFSNTFKTVTIEIAIIWIVFQSLNVPWATLSTLLWMEFFSFTAKIKGSVKQPFLKIIISPFKWHHEVKRRLSLQPTSVLDIKFSLFVIFENWMLFDCKLRVLRSKATYWSRYSFFKDTGNLRLRILRKTCVYVCKMH